MYSERINDYVVEHGLLHAFGLSARGRMGRAGGHDTASTLVNGIKLLPSGKLDTLLPLIFPCKNTCIGCVCGSHSIHRKRLAHMNGHGLVPVDLRPYLSYRKE